MTTNLRFLAKNSNARYTKSLRVSEKTVPGFLAKICNASQKSSPFLRVSKEFLDARTLESSYKCHLKEEIEIEYIFRRK